MTLSAHPGGGGEGPFESPPAENGVEAGESEATEVTPEGRFHRERTEEGMGPLIYRGEIGEGGEECWDPRRRPGTNGDKVAPLDSLGRGGQLFQGRFLPTLEKTEGFLWLPQEVETLERYTR